MKQFLSVVLLVLALSACGTPITGASPDLAAAMDTSTLQDYGLAPELHNTIWLNVDHPLHLADLRGKVVLLEMWTFECVNCQHVMPSLKAWYQKYTGQGLVIIGNHYPEFPEEANLDNLKQAIQRFQIPYAVAQDNDGATWNAYDNRYWPALYLIDKYGHIRYLWVGEGGYDQTETAIKTLLAELNS